MGLLDNTPEDMSQLGLIGGLLTAKKGENWGLLLQNAAQAMEQRRQRMMQEQLMQQQLATGNLNLQTQQRSFDESQRARDILQQPQGQQPYQAAPAPGGKGIIATQGPQGASNSKFDTFNKYNALADKLESSGLVDQAKVYRDLAEKVRPEVKEVRNMTAANGQRVSIAIYKDGSHEVMPYNPDAEKAHFANVGNKVLPLDAFSGKPVGQGQDISVSPDSALSASTQRRGQDMTDNRARELNAITQQGQNTQIVDNANMGPMLVDKKTGTSKPVINTATNQPIPSENQIKQKQGADAVLGLLDEAEKYLPDATGSVVGTGVDIAARGVGYATGGAKASASLKVIEGSLLSKMPRMEGPQSNMDVLAYRQAAGEIGNPTIPRAQKMQAVQTIRSIQKKYASAPGSQAPASGGWGMRQID